MGHKTGVLLLQWLARAREALKGEIQSVLAQSQQVADSIQSVQQAAEGQPPSPQKAVAAQVRQGVLGPISKS